MLGEQEGQLPSMSSSMGAGDKKCSSYRALCFSSWSFLTVLSCEEALSKIFNSLVEGIFFGASSEAPKLP